MADNTVSTLVATLEDKLEAVSLLADSFDRLAKDAHEASNEQNITTRSGAQLAQWHDGRASAYRAAAEVLRTQI